MGEKVRGCNIAQEERWGDKRRKVVMGKSNRPEKDCFKLYSLS